MKTLSSGSRVPSRLYYYLLDFNDENREFMFDLFHVTRLYDLTKDQFYELFQYASGTDFNNK